MKNVEIKIKGMHCKSCTMLVGDALRDIEGVKDADVSLEKNTAKVSFDEKLVKPEKMIDAIKKEGYDAKI
ncbi:MAG TPA: heavy metal-associated domain-containing protein [Alphaproteobacteria bacterium]|nr:heavy metal-associated domain-containing protein [Alphaproteobacteria bacterium]